MCESETPSEPEAPLGEVVGQLRAYATAEVTHGPNWDPSWDDETGKPKE